jgi:hypothetical protein
MSLQSSPENAVAIADVRSDSTPTDICMFGYEGTCISWKLASRAVGRVECALLRLLSWEAISQV